MGEKKQNKNEGEKKDEGKGGGKKEDNTIVTVVLKVDLHCEGCGSKVVKYLKGVDGVENAKADCDTNKVTVIGKADPSMLREKLEHKTKKKVELLSPAPKKDKKNDGGGDNKAEKKQEKKPDDKKPKETPVTTAVLKMDLHCGGCIEKIQRTVSKTKGVESKSIDKQKNLITVTGTMDVKALAESLKEKLKRPVEIVPPKKDAGGGGSEKKGKDGDKKKGDGGGKKEEGAVKAEENYSLHESMPGFGITAGPGQFYPLHFAHNPQMYGSGYGYGPGFAPGYAPPPGYGYGGYEQQQPHAPQIFSDENPNACSVM